MEKVSKEIYFNTIYQNSDKYNVHEYSDIIWYDFLQVIIKYKL